MDIQEALDQTNRLIAEKQLQMDDLADDLTELHRERVGLEAALIRWKGAPVAPPPDASWLALGRSEAVERSLQQMQRAVSLAELEAFLRSTGRSGDTPGYISAALAYLKRTGRAEDVRRGVWRVKPKNATGPAANGAGAETSPLSDH